MIYSICFIIGLVVGIGGKIVYEIFFIETPTKNYLPKLFIVREIFKERNLSEKSKEWLFSNKLELKTFFGNEYSKLHSDYEAKIKANRTFLQKITATIQDKTPAPNFERDFEEFISTGKFGLNNYLQNVLENEIKRRLRNIIDI